MSCFKKSVNHMQLRINCACTCKHCSCVFTCSVVHYMYMYIYMHVYMYTCMFLLPIPLHVVLEILSSYNSKLIVFLPYLWLMAMFPQEW